MPPPELRLASLQTAINGRVMTDEKKPYKMSPAVLAAQRRAMKSGAINTETFGVNEETRRAASQELARILVGSLSKESILEVVRLLTKGVDIKELSSDLRKASEQD